MMLLIRLMARFTIHFPVPKATLDSWVNMLDDIVKVSLLAIPAVIWLDNHSTAAKIIGIICLLITAYLGAWSANRNRIARLELTVKESKDA